MQLTLDRLKQLLSYDRNSGQFVWLDRTTKTTNIAVGSVAGCVRTSGYCVICIDGRAYKAHRLAWMYEHGSMPEKDIDHINGIKSDNRICNLRQATNQQNAENKRKPHSNNSHGYLGVSKEGPRWKARIRVDYKEKYLGLFGTPEEAHAAYLSAIAKFHPFQTIAT